jgi:hypothetical protein
MSHIVRAGLLVFVLVAGLLAFAACGDDDSDVDGGEPTATSEPSDGEPTEPSDGAGGDGDAASELQDLAGRALDQELKITYQFAGGGLDGTMTLAWLPPNSWRVDLASADGDFTLINAGEGSFFCTSDGGEGTCLSIPGGGDALDVPFLGFLTNPDELSSFVVGSFAGVDVERSSDSIAGEDVTCYSVAGEVEGEEGSGTFCFNDDGVMLRMQASSPEGDFTLEATDFSSDVSEADFEPPYPVQDLAVP